MTITAVALFGVFKYNQTPNLYGTVGLILIVIGVVLLNLFGKAK
jgi:small multidrug resistance pump